MFICKTLKNIVKYNSLFKYAITELSKVAGAQINVQASVVFLYTSNEHSKNEVKKIMAFTVSSKRKYNTEE